MLLPREKRIVELLYKEQKPFTAVELASILQISSRTIKADIKKIKFELEATGCEILTKTGKGIWLEYNACGKRYLDGLTMNDDNSPSILPESRKYYIALELLNSPDFVSMESISEKLYVSKGTIMNDVNKLASFFNAFNLELNKAVKFGVKIDGSERQRRICKANVLRKIVVYQGNEVIEKLQPFFEIIDIRYISSLIQEAEDEFGFILSDTSYFNLLLHISIAIERIKQGNLCAYSKKDSFKYDDSSEWKLVDFFRKQLSQEYEVVLMKGDVDYIYMNVLGSKFQNKEIYNLNDLSIIRELSPKNFDTLLEIIREVDFIYGESLSDDNDFVKSLFIHINALFTRLMNSIYLENPLKMSIKKELAYEYEIGTYFSRLIERDYVYRLSDDDICDIALYVGASIKRKKAKKIRENPEVIIVCATGLSTSQFIEAKLKLSFPSLIIKDTIPLIRVEHYIKHNEVDLIISTVPIDLQLDHIVVISPMLNKSDIQMIQTQVQLITEPQKEQTGKYGALISYLSENITILSCDCRTSDEVIHYLGSRLQSEKYVDEGFITSVLKREDFSPTAIGDRFAIPHSFRGHVLKPGIAMMTLRKPIAWGKEKVQIVLMISLDPDSKESFKTIFAQLADLTKDFNLVTQLLECSHYKEIIKLLKTEGK